MKKKITMFAVTAIAISLMSASGISASSGTQDVIGYEGLTFAVDSSIGEAGDSVSIDINVAHNPGITVVSFGLQYPDDELTLISATTLDEMLPLAYWQTKYDENVGQRILLFNGTDDSAKDGGLVRLNFKINDAATTGIKEIRLACLEGGEPVNANEVVFNGFGITNGIINVVDELLLAYDFVMPEIIEFKEGLTFLEYTSFAPSYGVRNGEEITGLVEWFADEDFHLPVSEDFNGDEITNDDNFVLFWRFTPESAEYSVKQGRIVFTSVDGSNNEEVMDE